MDKQPVSIISKMNRWKEIRKYGCYLEKEFSILERILFRYLWIMRCIFNAIYHILAVITIPIWGIPYFTIRVIAEIHHNKETSVCISRKKFIKPDSRENVCKNDNGTFFIDDEIIQITMDEILSFVSERYKFRIQSEFYPSTGDEIFDICDLILFNRVYDKIAPAISEKYEISRPAYDSNVAMDAVKLVFSKYKNDLRAFMWVYGYKVHFSIEKYTTCTEIKVIVHSETKLSDNIFAICHKRLIDKYFDMRYKQTGCIEIA